MLATAPLNNDGIILYGDSNANPRQRTYVSSTGSFGAEAATVNGAIPRSVALRTSSIRQEAIAGYQTATGTLQVMCYDGPTATWTNEWSVYVGSSTKRFDIAYEKSTGDAVVLYSKDVATTNELATRVKQATTTCGSANWSAETSVNPARTSGKVHWVKIAPDRRPTSSLLAAAWADANRDLSAMIWNGNSWGNEPASTTETSLEIVSVAQDVDDFDLDYESLSGDILFIWSNSAGASGTNGMRMRTCISGPTCTWSGTSTITGGGTALADDAEHLDLAASPTSDEMVFGSIGAGASDMQAGYWSGSAWTLAGNFDISAGGANILGLHKTLAAGWLVSGATKKGILVYQDGTSSGGTPAVSFASTTTGTWNPSPGQQFAGTPTLTVARKWTEIAPNPISMDRFMLTFSDNNTDLWAKQLFMTSAPAFIWSNTEGGSVALEDSLPQATSSPFAFGYWQAPTLEQADYRFYNNNNGYQVSSTLTAADNTAATLPTPGAAFRLRMILRVDATALNSLASSSTPQLKLQFATSTAGGCDTSFSGETYADVATGSGNIRFNDNSTPVDGMVLTPTSTPTHGGDTIVSQSYEEANNFTATTSVPAGQDGIWDFSLADFTPAASGGGQTYCFRVVHAGGSLLDTYTYVPEVKTASPAFTQAVYRWFANANSTDVGAALAATNTAATQVNAGDAFRLRMLLRTDNATATTATPDNLKLQFSTRGADNVCDTGFSGESYQDVNSPEGADWTRATSSAAWSARTFFGSVVYDSKMWLFGGTSGGNKNDVWSSTDGVTWTEATSSAEWDTRQGLGSVVHDSKMWAFGGFGSTTQTNDVWSSTDGITWTQATSSAAWPKRFVFGALTYNGAMWLFGGNGGTNLNDVWSSTDGITWTQATSSAAWPVRAGLGSVVYNGKMWIFGGLGASYYNDVWSSTDGITWTQATSSAAWSARRYLGSLVYSNKMWVFGGINSGGASLNDVWSSTDGITWTQATDAAPWTGRYSPGVLNFATSGWVFGGASSTNMNDVWYFASGTSTLRFYNNTSATDGTALTANANDPTDGTRTVVNESYEEGNNFANSIADIGVGKDGMWDFSLVADASDNGTNYCFRAVNSDGSLLSSYTIIPEITTASPGVSCSTNISSTAFGALPPGSVSTATTNASTTMTCSGGLGCTLTVQDQGNGTNPGLATTSPAYLIPSADATLAAGTEGYGIQATSTASGSGGTLTIKTVYNVTSTVVGGLLRTATTLASSTAAVTGREVLVVHKAAISAVTPPGSYNDTITYSCTAN